MSERRKNKSIFGFVSVDVCVTKLMSLQVPNEQSIFYLQEKKKSIYKDTLNTFDLTSKMHILRIYIVVE